MPLIDLTKEKAELLGAKTKLDDEDEVLSRFGVKNSDRWSWARIIKVSVLTLLVVFVTMTLLILPVVYSDGILVYVEKGSTRVIDVDRDLIDNERWGSAAIIDMKGPLSSFSNRTYFYLNTTIIRIKNKTGKVFIEDHQFGIIPPELAEALDIDFLKILNKKSVVIDDVDLTE